MEDLVCEYKRSLQLLKKSRAANVSHTGMISDTEWAIRYMETGQIPGAKWTVSRWSREKREIPVDPLKMAGYVAGRETVSPPVPEQVLTLLDRLMESLTSREKEAFKLVRGEYYSFSQAGMLMGCTKGTIQNLVNRAEKKIALVIRKQTISEEVIGSKREYTLSL
jgi:RNA polymerase sigma-70 factor (ECF subfamily)